MGLQKVEHNLATKNNNICHHINGQNLKMRYISPMTFFAHSNPRSFYTEIFLAKMELLLEEILKELKFDGVHTSTVQ